MPNHEQSDRRRDARARELGLPVDHLRRPGREKGRKRALKQQQVHEVPAAVKVVEEHIQDLTVATKIVEEQTQNLAAATRRLNAFLNVAMPWADELLLPPAAVAGVSAQSSR